MKTNSLIISAFLFLFTTCPAQAQQYAWQPQAGGTNASLEAVTFVDAETGWAVGGAKGNDWERLPCWSSTASIEAIDALDGTVAWLGGWDGIRKTTDGGQTWIQQKTGVYDKIQFLDAQTGWATDMSNLHRTTDGGASWKSSYLGTILYGFHFPTATTGWTVGSAGKVWKSTDGGGSWAAQTSGVAGDLNDVCFIGATTGWAVGDGGQILKTTDGGSTWTPQSSPTTLNLLAVTAWDENRAWASGEDATLLHTTDGGATWTGQTLPIWPPYDLEDIDFADATTGFTVGMFGTTYRSTDGGTSWHALTSGSTGWLHGVHAVDERTVWAVGSSGTILKTARGCILHTAGGRDGWVAQTSNTISTLFGVSFPDGQRGWAVGSKGAILHTTDGGGQWTPQASGTSKDLRGVCFVDSQTGYAVGRGGTFLRTVNGGSLWETLAFPRTNDLFGVHFGSADRGWVCGSAGSVFLTGDGGASWDYGSIDTVNLYGVCFTDANNGWSVGGGGTILKTGDGGWTWFEQDSGTTSELRSVVFVDAGTGWAAGAGGTILKTANGGEFWVRQAGGTTSQFNGLAAVDPVHAWVVGDAGAILEADPATDSQAPELQIDQPLPGETFYLANLPIMVHGTATDPNGVEVLVGSVRVPLTRGDFSYNYYLPGGDYTLPVWAADTAGNVTEVEVPFHVDIDFPAGEATWYLVGSGDQRQLSRTPAPDNVTYKQESYGAGFTIEFPVTLDQYVTGDDYPFDVCLAAASRSTFTLNWLVERDGRRDLLASASFAVSSSTYYYYSGTAEGQAAVALKGQRLIFQVVSSASGGCIWGVGSGGSQVHLPGGTAFYHDGDVDADGWTTAADLAIVAHVQAGNLQEGQAPCRRYENGDFNDSGQLDAADYLVIAALLAENPM